VRRKTFHGETSEPSNLRGQILSLTISVTCNSRAFLILWLLACISVLGSPRLSWCVVCLTFERFHGPWIVGREATWENPEV